MTPNFRTVGPKGAETGTYTMTFVYQGPFKKNSSTGFRVINEVVLEVWNSRRFAGSVSSRAQLMLQGSAPRRRPPTRQGGRPPRLSSWRRPWSPSAPSVSVFSGDADPRGGSHVPVVGL